MFRKRYSWIAIIAVSFLLLFASYYDVYDYYHEAKVESEVCRRPIYNLAHMVNSIPEVTYYLDKGANGIESDVTFYRRGKVKVRHGSPCDCGRQCFKEEDLGNFLTYIRNITTPGSPDFRPEMVFLNLDLKLEGHYPGEKLRSGEKLARQLIDHLWTKDIPRSQVNLLLSIQHTSDKSFMVACHKILKANLPDTILRDKIGWDVGMNDGVENIQAMWNEVAISRNLWIGDGITSCLNVFKNLMTDKRLKTLIKSRDSGKGPHKIYKWTIDDPDWTRRLLRLTVDSVMSNYPERTRDILQEPEFRDGFRLATILDNPWERFQCPQNIDPFTTKVSNLWNSGIKE